MENVFILIQYIGTVLLRTFLSDYLKNVEIMWTDGLKRLLKDLDFVTISHHVFGLEDQNA